MFTPLTGSHCKLRPNTEGIDGSFIDSYWDEPNNAPDLAWASPDQLMNWTASRMQAVQNVTNQIANSKGVVSLNILNLYGARFPTEIYTRGCHWIPRMFA
jgi:hypothetical protein